MLQAFAKLSPEDQQLMRLLCAVPPIDYQTIAEMLGRPIGSIGPTRARCLERLKKLLPPGLDPKEGSDVRPDDDLLELVGRALRAADPVPERVIEGARAAWTWRTIDEELAELVFDSAAELTGVRSEDTARQVTFQRARPRDRGDGGRRGVPPHRRPAGPARRLDGASC